MSVVITGRLMQAWEIFTVTLPGSASDLDPGAVGQQKVAVGYDLFAAVETAFDDGFAAERPGYLYRSYNRGVVFHHEDEIALLADLHRSRRYHHRVFGSQRKLRGHKGAGPQQLILVRHSSADRRHAGRGIDRVFDHGDAAVRLALVAGNDHRDRGYSLRDRQPDLRQVALWHHERDIDGGHLVDGGNRHRRLPSVQNCRALTEAWLIRPLIGALM